MSLEPREETPFPRSEFRLHLTEIFDLIADELDQPDPALPGSTRLYGVIAGRVLDEVDFLRDPDKSYEFLAFVGALSLIEDYTGRPRNRRTASSSTKTERRRTCRREDSHD